MRWLEPPNVGLLGYMIGEKLLVLVNADVAEGIFSDVRLPAQSRWKLGGNAESIEPEKGIPGKSDSVLQGAAGLNLHLPPQSVKIWAREK